jgi:hypothetical protein
MGLGDPKMHELRQEAFRVAGEIRKLSPAILAGAVLDEVAIANDYGIIDFKAYATPDNQRIYLVAVNTSSTEIQPTFFIPNMRGTVHILNELRDIPRPNGQFSDKFEPYQSHIYNIRMKQDLKRDDSDNDGGPTAKETNVSEIIDPKGNLEGNTQKAYLDIVKASVYQEGENCIFTVTVADDFPAPKQLGNDDAFTFIWFVDIDRNRATGQGKTGNDYNLHLGCSNKNAWFKGWIKTTDASKQDGITIDRKEIIIRIKDNTAALIFPKNYLPSDQFDWWVNTWTRPTKGSFAARRPLTHRGAFKRPLSGGQAILLSSFDSNQPLTSSLFPGIMWRANTGQGQSVSTCQIDHNNGACGTSSSVKWSYQIQGTWVNLGLLLSGSNWSTPVDLSMYDAISFYIKGTGTRGCRLKLQTASFDGGPLISKMIRLDVNTHWKKIEVPLKNNPKLNGLNLPRTHTMAFVDSPPGSTSNVVWIDQIYFHIKRE